jgi:dolichol-phosphate mannosyltransferase
VRLFVCIPTYNERENIQAILQAILSVVPTASIVVADDNSPDGTAELAASVSNQVTVLLRKGNRGFAAAYKDAFVYALKNHADVILQMDADFSHDPNYIPEMLEALHECDFVVGSRYTAGGKVTNWPFHRRLLSRWANFYTSFFVRSTIRDMTSGFTLWRRDALEKIPFAHLKSEGYCFLIELKHRALRRGLKAVEVPINFIDRTKAKSKMSFSRCVEAAVMVPILAFSQRIQEEQQPELELDGKTEVLTLKCG